MNKTTILPAILEKLRDEFEQRQRVSKEIRSAGNDTESRAENKYDTLSTEQNYLADGFAKQAFATAQAAESLEKLRLDACAPDEPIDLGALVEVEFADRAREWFFVAPAAGGTEVELEGKTVTVLTPESPLGSQLVGRKVGESTVAPKVRIRAVV
jgi:transcription elongation GreA/GreB family factor